MTELIFKKFSEETQNKAINFILYSRNKISKLSQNGDTIHEIKIFICDKLSLIQWFSEIKPFKMT